MQENNSFQKEVLEKLSSHSVLLATIASEIGSLKNSDDRLGDDYEGLMLKIDKLEDRVRSLELKLAFASVLGTLVASIGGAIAYLLSK